MLEPGNDVESAGFNPYDTALDRYFMLSCDAACPLQFPPDLLARYDVMGGFYEIVSLRRVAPPPGAKGANWHRYVIALNGTETIHGHRRGSIKDVTKEVEEIVVGLNQRHRKSIRFG